MSSEIPINTEAEQWERDLNPMYTRVIDILEYQNEYPEEDWKNVPELAYMQVGSIDGPRTLSIRKVSVFNYINHEEENKSGLFIELYYLSSQVPFRKLRKIEPSRCKVHCFTIPEGERSIRIRELYGHISGTISDTLKPSEKELQKTQEYLSFSLTPEEKKRIFLEEERK